jgi:hypothetical protein
MHNDAQHQRQQDTVASMDHGDVQKYLDAKLLDAAKAGDTAAVAELLKAGAGLSWVLLYV